MINHWQMQYLNTAVLAAIQAVEVVTRIEWFTQERGPAIAE